MSRFILIFLSLGMLAIGNARLMGFVLLGPYEEWQEPEIGYDIGGDLGGPMNIGNEYRRNTPEMYYSFDEEFVNFFGSHGIQAVTNAYLVLNNIARTNLSDYSSNLTEFPLNSSTFDGQAGALGLYDVKTFTLRAMMEQLGLGDPVRFTWGIRTRAELDIEDVDCPGNVVYTVVQRNFDISPSPLTDTVYSTDVNGISYASFVMYEDCGDGADPSAYPQPTGPFSFALAEGFLTGYFADNLTRDDVAGLRYMLRAGNVNPESTGNNAFAFVTNATPILIFPESLQSLAETAPFSDAATLEVLFPGLQVTGSSNYFVNVIQTNVTGYFTNPPYAPVGSPPEFVVVTNFTTNIQTRFAHTFGNLITNEYYPYCIQSRLITNIAPSPFAPPGSGISVTNVSIQTYVDTNCVSGSFIIPPGDACGVQILSTQLTELVTVTNLIFFASTTFTNTGGFSEYREVSESIVDYWTNRILLGRSVDCPEDVGGLRRGIEKISYFRRDYDSLLGQFFAPITNFYDHVVIQNNQEITQRVGRVVTGPDFLFSAADLVEPEPEPYVWYVWSRNLNFSDSAGGGPGPGRINPGTTITLNNVGLGFEGGPTLDTNVFVTDQDLFPQFLWGSFDGSTNDPIVFPNGTSILEVENWLLMQIVTASLPDATAGQPYNSGPLSGQGGVQPYTWSLSPLTALPPGLSPPNPVNGSITGTPTTPGPYYFSIRMTDSTARFVDRAFLLNVNPP